MPRANRRHAHRGHGQRGHHFVPPLEKNAQPRSPRGGHKRTSAKRSVASSTRRPSHTFLMPPDHDLGPEHRTRRDRCERRAHLLPCAHATSEGG
jgi:hypothetical protein